MTPKIRVGPDGSPSRESPETAVDLLVSGGYTACELDFEGGFWLEPDSAQRFGHLAAAADIALSIHAPSRRSSAILTAARSTSGRWACSTIPRTSPG